MPRVSKKANVSNEKVEEIDPNTPYNGQILHETEHYHMDVLVYIYQNWDKLGSKVGKAFVNGELIDNAAFKSIIEKLICHTTTNDKIYPLADNKVAYKQGELKFGRYQTQNFGLINMARPVRQSIAWGLYQDIDFVNCHLYVYKYLCDNYKLKCPSINKYIKEREKHLEDLVAANPDCDRDAGKKWFLQLLNGGLGKEVKNKTEFMTKFEKELRDLQPKLCAKIEIDYPTLREHVVKKNGINTWNITCKIVSKVLEDNENRMRHYLGEYVKSQGFDFSSHCYDGGMSYLPLNKSEITAKLNLKKTQAYILEKCGIDCPLKFKEFDEKIDIPEEELKKITITDYQNIKRGISDEYEAVKYRFEKQNFFCDEEVNYYYENNNKVIYYSKEKFIIKYEDITYTSINEEGKEEKQTFIHKWMKDTSKRRYDSVKWAPQGGYYISEGDEEEQKEIFVKQGGYIERKEYNTWKGFEVEKVQPDGNDHTEGVNYILNHFRYLVNNEEQHFNYFIKWIASLFQAPHRKTEVCVGIKSALQGIGKTYIFDLMCEMMGTDLTAKIENPENDLFGDFNEAIHNTIFVLLEEWDASINTKYQKRMLDAITCKFDNINFKHKHKGSYSSYTNYMCVWNNFGMRIVENDRRVWANESTAETRPSSEYFDKLYYYSQNPQTKRALFEYLLRVDLRNFKASRDRTDTVLREEMLTQQHDKILDYLKEIILDHWRYKSGITNDYPTTEVDRYGTRVQISMDMTDEERANEYSTLTKERFDHFKQWIKDSNLQYRTDIATFGKKIAKLKCSAVETYTSSGKSKFRLKVDEGIEWLKQMKLLVDEELEERD